MALDDAAARETREAGLTFNRVKQLELDPIKGNFDAAHLKAVHAFIFQDLPHHKPGVVRSDTENWWTKTRQLEGAQGGYEVAYAHRDVAGKIDAVLREFGGPQSLRGQPAPVVAERLGKLYGDLDHAHGFHEGNSRTLREFTREMAAAAGHNLEWSSTSVSAAERNRLYLARDAAVLDRAFPGLTPERGWATNDRLEYETSMQLPHLRRLVGENTLEAIIEKGLTPRPVEAVQPVASASASVPVRAASAEDYWGKLARQAPAGAASASSVTAAPDRDKPKGMKPR